MTEKFHTASETPDAELVRACRRGEKRAFVEIVARHQAMVCGVAFAILNDFAASEDAAQEAFLTAWRKIRELREPDRLRAWLAQIARNAALAQRRRRDPEEEIDKASGVSDAGARPDEATACGEEAQLVRASLERLPELYRSPLVLFYREGQSVRAVAESLSISEDAVKQRLARGREMLRERMETVIGRVLERNVPGAVFTMTIAAAIGALAAPSTIAAAAFATAGTATTTSSSIVTAMSTTKAALATAGLITVACIPVGYHLAGGSIGDPIAQSESRATQHAVEQKRPTFENTVLFAEWRALHEKHGTNAAAMPGLYQAIQDLPDPYRRRAFSSAQIAEWARIDGANGLAFLQKKKRNSEEAQEFFSEWYAVSPEAALNALLTGERAESEVARNSLLEIARRFPQKLSEVVSRMPEPENFWQTEVSDAFGLIATEDLRVGRTMAELVSGPNREQALSGVAKIWGKSKVDEAVVWAKGLPESTDRNEVIRAALLGKASVDPVGALDLTDIVPPAPSRPGYAHITTARRVLEEAAKSDFEATVGWLVARPGRFSRNDLTGISEAITQRLNSDPMSYLQTWATEGSLPVLLPAIGSALLNRAGGQRDQVWEWLKRQPESDTTRSLREEVLGSGAFKDVNTSLQRAKEVSELPDGPFYLQEMAGRLLNGGNDLHRFDTLYAEAPEPLKQPLLEQAFRYLSPETVDENWLGRLAKVPESQRLKATESMARAWAGRAPEDTISWINSLPVTERAAAAAGAADGMARTQPTLAAEWVGSMEPGMEQDRAAGALVKRITEDRPNQAWEWAGRINDAAERDQAASYVVKQVAERNPSLAAEWLRSDRFSEKRRDELRAALGFAGGEK